MRTSPMLSMLYSMMGATEVSLTGEVRRVTITHKNANPVVFPERITAALSMLQYFSCYRITRSKSAIHIRSGRWFSSGYFIPVHVKPQAIQLCRQRDLVIENRI